MKKNPRLLLEVADFFVYLQQKFINGTELALKEWQSGN